jgi:hypothetical protein
VVCIAEADCAIDILDSALAVRYRASNDNKGKPGY